jgi:hypothetical protein
VCPLAAQSPPTQQTIKPSPKQERTTKSGPPQISQQQPRTNDHQKNTPAINANERKTPISNTASDKPYDYEKAYLKIQAQLSNSTKKIANLTFFLVVVGFLQAFIFLVQIKLLRGTLRATKVAANAARDNAKVAVNTMEHTQRAYVFIKELFTVVKQAEGAGDIRIVLENTGETPVRKMICNYNYRCFPGDIPSDFDYPDTDPPLYGVIGRKTILDVRVLIPFSAFENTRTKTQRLYIYGWVDYNDVFPNTSRHRTESCYEVVISEDRGFKYNIYGNYNGTDDECSRKPSPYVPPT